jgi:hypothetical protein
VESVGEELSKGLEKSSCRSGWMPRRLVEATVNALSDAK